MAEPPACHASRWKVVLCALAVVCSILGGTGVWVWSVGERRWGEMKKQLVEILREDLARPAERPVLRGEASPGNAWDDYQKAMLGIKSLTWKEVCTLQTFVYRQPQSDPAAVEQLLVRFGPFLDQLRRGAGRAHARALYRGPEGESLVSLNTQPPQWIRDLAAGQARVLADRGRGREAAELLLDLCQFSRDLGWCVPNYDRWSSPWIVEFALDELRRLVLSGSLTSDDLLEVGRELDILDRSGRVVGPLEPVDIMDLGFDFLESDHLFTEIHSNRLLSTEFHGVYPWEGWKYGFSDRLMVARAIDEALGYARESSAVRGAPWSESTRIWDGLNARMAKSRNPVVREFVARLRRGDLSDRQRLAWLHLLRVAAQFRATGEILDLEDPFGTRLHHRQHGSHLKVWSVGREGTDHGGVGQWKPPGGEDILLEVER